MEERDALRRSARGGMQISSRSAGAVLVMSLSGPMQAEDSLKLGQSFSEHLESGCRGFVLDLGELTYIDSTLIAEIIVSRQRAAELSAEIQLVAPPASKAREILRITTLDRVFQIHDSVDGALACMEIRER
jgi:anti-sigma B factor antagonist